MLVDVISHANDRCIRLAGSTSFCQIALRDEGGEISTRFRKLQFELTDVQCCFIDDACRAADEQLLRCQLTLDQNARRRSTRRDRAVILSSNPVRHGRLGARIR